MWADQSTLRSDQLTRPTAREGGNRGGGWDDLHGSCGCYVHSLVPRPYFFTHALWSCRKIGSGQVHWENWVSSQKLDVNYIISNKFWPKIYKLAIGDDYIIISTSNLIGVTKCRYTLYIRSQFQQWRFPDRMFWQGRRVHVKKLMWVWNYCAHGINTGLGNSHSACMNRLSHCSGFISGKEGCLDSEWVFASRECWLLHGH